jgi:hypothetical protein
MFAGLQGYNFYQQKQKTDKKIAKMQKQLKQKREAQRKREIERERQIREQERIAKKVDNQIKE